MKDKFLKNLIFYNLVYCGVLIKNDTTVPILKTTTILYGGIVSTRTATFNHRIKGSPGTMKTEAGVRPISVTVRVTSNGKL